MLLDAIHEDDPRRGQTHNKEGKQVNGPIFKAERASPLEGAHPRLETRGQNAKIRKKKESSPKKSYLPASEKRPSLREGPNHRVPPGQGTPALFTCFHPLQEAPNRAKTLAIRYEKTLEF